MTEEFENSHNGFPWAWNLTASPLSVPYYQINKVVCSLQYFSHLHIHLSLILAESSYGYKKIVQIKYFGKLSSFDGDEQEISVGYV